MTKPLKNPFEEYEDWKPFLESDSFYQKSKAHSFENYLSQNPIKEGAISAELKSLLTDDLESLNQEKSAIESVTEYVKKMKV